MVLVIIEASAACSTRSDLHGHDAKPGGLVADTAGDPDYIEADHVQPNKGHDHAPQPHLHQVCTHDAAATLSLWPMPPLSQDIPEGVRKVAQQSMSRV